MTCNGRWHQISDFLIFFWKNEKSLELPDLARKFIRKTFQKNNPSWFYFVEKNEKGLELPDFARKLFRKKCTPSPTHVAEIFSHKLMGGG